MNVFDAVNRAEINENDRMPTLSNDCPQFFERQCMFGGSSESQFRAASTARSASVPYGVQSHRARKSASAMSTPKLPKTIRRQAGTHE